MSDLFTAIADAIARNANPKPEKSQPVDGKALLDDIAAFIARYLHCSEHQRTVLALWVLHTYCLNAAQVTPFLSIQSAQKQSGKTLCLQLLGMLCSSAKDPAGLTASRLTQLMQEVVDTLLLDECHASVGTRARSKAPALRALLSGGFHRGVRDFEGSTETDFCAKAFAGMGQLPEALADRSIPIILEPITNALENKPERVDLRRAVEEAQLLRRRLHDWSEQNLPDLEQKPPYPADAFPDIFSPRRRDMCEPLLQLADAIGGQWPKRIRQALITIFEDQELFDLQPSLKLLEDVHRCFFHYNYPQRISTAVLLEWMQTLPPRPWDMDGGGRISGYTFARLLMPFEIRPRLQRMDPENTARGYQLEDFLKAWRKHLGLNLVQTPAGLVYDSTLLSPESCDANAKSLVPPIGANSIPNGFLPLTSNQNPSVTDNHQSEIVNIHAVCNGVAHANAFAQKGGITPETTVEDQRSSA